MAHFAKFVSLARSPDELKEQAKKQYGPSMEQPVFPYGLCLSLDEDTIKKLGLDTDDCEVGAKIHLCCMAEVTDFSKRKMDDGISRRIELQITDIAFENEGTEGAAAFDNSERMSKRYGIGKAAAEDE
jgi:hypothetical protein